MINQEPKFQTIQEIAVPDSRIYLFCFLADGRLVTCGKRAIAVYQKNTYKNCMIFSKGSYDETLSLCALKNGGLVSAGREIFIRVWRIGEDNYKNIHILFGHEDVVNKVIELEDGKLCSCSDDKTIRIWDDKNRYKCIKILTEHTKFIKSIIEINNYVISAESTYSDKKVIIWNKQTFEVVKTIENVYSYSNNGILKLKDNTLIIGGKDELFILNILTFECVPVGLEDKIKLPNYFHIMKDGKIFIREGESNNLFLFDLYNQEATFIQSIQNNYIGLIVNEDNTVFISKRVRENRWKGEKFGKIITYELI